MRKRAFQVDALRKVLGIGDDTGATKGCRYGGPGASTDNRFVPLCPCSCATYFLSIVSREYFPVAYFRPSLDCEGESAANWEWLGN